MSFSAGGQSSGMESNRSTLFCGNLPFHMTNQDLEDVFSDIAPIRRAFVVTKRGSNTSSGVGFVTCATMEDAMDILDAIKSSPISFGGRAIKVSLTGSKDDAKRRKRSGDPMTSKSFKSAPVTKVQRLGAIISKPIVKPAPEDKPAPTETPTPAPAPAAEKPASEPTTDAPKPKPTASEAPAPAPAAPKPKREWVKRVDPKRVYHTFAEFILTGFKIHPDPARLKKALQDLDHRIIIKTLTLTKTDLTDPWSDEEEAPVLPIAWLLLQLPLSETKRVYTGRYPHNNRTAEQIAAGKTGGATADKPAVTTPSATEQLLDILQTFKWDDKRVPGPPARIYSFIAPPKPKRVAVRRGRRAREDFIEYNSGTIILRNLPFSTRAIQLWKEVRSFGPILSVRVPQKQHNRNRLGAGFAFVKFADPASAHGSVAHAKVMIGGRTAVIDMAMSKKQFEGPPAPKAEPTPSEHPAPAPAPAPAPVDEGDLSDDDMSGDVDAPAPAPAPAATADEAMDGEESETSSEDDEGEEEHKEGRSSIAKSSITPEELTRTAFVSDVPTRLPRGRVEEALQALQQRSEQTYRREHVEGEEGEEGEEGAGAEPTQRANYEAALSAALRQELRRSFRSVGPVSRVVVVSSASTGRPTGAAFVVFSTSKGFKACMKAAEAAEGRDKKNRHKRLTSHIVSASRPGAVGLAVAGQRVRVRPAVRKQDTVADHSEVNEDPRNVALSRIGLMVPGVAGFDIHSVPTADLKKRATSWANRKKQLRNPNFHVNPLRLAIRNLPPGLEDEGLAALCARAAVSRSTAKAALPESERKAKGAVEREQVRSAGIREARVICDDDDVFGVKGRSKGFGFVEFAKHELALECLTNLNNNPKVFSSQQRPIVEFAVENVNRKVRRRRQGGTGTFVDRKTKKK